MIYVVFDIVIYYDAGVKSPFLSKSLAICTKNNKMSSIMHDKTETQGIVEAFAEHDFHALGSVEWFVHPAAKILFFVHIANT